MQLFGVHEFVVHTTIVAFLLLYTHTDYRVRDGCKQQRARHLRDEDTLSLQLNMRMFLFLFIQQCTFKSKNKCRVVYKRIFHLLLMDIYAALRRAFNNVVDFLQHYILTINVYCTDGLTLFNDVALVVHLFDFLLFVDTLISPSIMQCYICPVCARTTNTHTHMWCAFNPVTDCSHHWQVRAVVHPDAMLVYGALCESNHIHHNIAMRVPFCHNS
jgi:hypothetical protein